MRYWVCYHNAKKRGSLPGDYEGRVDPEEFADDGDTRNLSLSSIYTEKTEVRDALGDTLFLIVGIGSSPKKFFLWSWFVIENVEEVEPALFEASGTRGAVLSPVPRLSGSDFDQFKKRVGNFGFGFQNITEYPYVDRLLHLADLNGE